MIVIVLLLAAAYIFVSHQPESEKPQKELTSAQVLSLLKQNYDLETLSGSKVIVGKYMGTAVVVDFPCSDVCPANTFKIVRYDVEWNQCADIGGKIEELKFPMGIAVGLKKFCVPKVIYGQQKT